MTVAVLKVRNLHQMSPVSRSALQDVSPGRNRAPTARGVRGWVGKPGKTNTVASEAVLPLFDPSSTMQVVDRLIEANNTFDAATPTTTSSGQE